MIPMDQNHTETTSAEFGGDTIKFSSETPAQVAVLPDRVDLTGLSVAPDTALLQNFLRRPVNIYTHEWEGTSVSNHIDPWALFMNTPSVSQKLTGYKFMRSTLHIDVQINGTPFHFGRLLMSYEPANGLRRSIDGDSRQHSNLPHVLLDPSVNTVGKFKLPFISPNLWADITDVEGMMLGVLNFDYVSALHIFEGGQPDSVTIQVYAWLEDLELAFPTQKIPATFTQQAGKKVKPNNGNTKKSGNDEYEVNPNAGMISKPAAMLADVAGRLTTVPVIGSFATATQIGAGAISKIAALFGYSSPKDLTNPDVLLQRPVGYMATCDTADPVVSLTVNSKSELTVDPGVIGFGCNEDELTVKSIASKWTLADSRLWNRTDLPDTILMRESISPTMLSKLSVQTNLELDLTSACYAALPFLNWHGSMEIRVQVVCSNYHRGRLRFQWTPEESLSQDIQLGYNHVVDICDTKEFHLKLPYAGKEGFKTIPAAATWGDGFFNPNDHSGRIKIIVQNKLVCPTDEPIELLIWVRAGDDMEFANPDFNFVSRTSTVPRVISEPGAVPSRPTSVKLHKASSTVQQSGDIVNEWESEEIITFFDDQIHEDYSLAFYADPVRSFRTLLNRYTLVTSLGWRFTAADQDYTRYAGFIPLYPQVAGFVPNGSWINGTARVNVTATHLVNYLEVSFLAKKGGFRHIVDLTHNGDDNNLQSSNIGLTRVSDKNFAGSYSTGMNNLIASNSRGTRAAAASLGMDAAGSVSNRYINDMNPGGGQIFGHLPSDNRVSYEMPFYHPYRYVTHLGDIAPTENATSEWRDTSSQAAVITFAVSPYEGGQEASDYSPTARVYSAAAEDFTMHFYLGPPVLYLDTLPQEATAYSTDWAREPFIEL